MPTRDKTNWFLALDGFRGLCALVVVLFHLPLELPGLAHRFFLPNAQMLMDFFFVMSGFIIAGAFEGKLHTWTDVGGFARSRFARLWPLHAAMLILLVGIEAAKTVFLPAMAVQPDFSGTKTVQAIVTNLLLVHSLHTQTSLTWNAPSWTVSVEFYTYLLFAALCVLWPRGRVASAVVMAVVGALGVALIARRLDATYDYGVFRCFYGFFCGVVTLHVFRARPLGGLRRGGSTLVEMGALVGIFAYIATLGGPPFGFVGPLLFSLFIWIFAAEQGLASQALAWRPLVWLGKVSYSIYLVHFPMLIMAYLSLRLFEHVAHVNLAALGYTGVDQMNFVHAPPGHAWVLGVIALAYLGSVIAVAGQSFKYIEGPGRRLLTPRRRPRPVVALTPSFAAG